MTFKISWYTSKKICVRICVTAKSRILMLRICLGSLFCIRSLLSERDKRGQGSLFVERLLPRKRFNILKAEMLKNWNTRKSRGYRALLLTLTMRELSSSFRLKQKLGKCFLERRRYLSISK